MAEDNENENNETPDNDISQEIDDIENDEEGTQPVERKGRKGKRDKPPKRRSSAGKAVSHAAVAPFAIEADHPNNCDLLIQAIPGCRLRSAINGSKTLTNPTTGKSFSPVDRTIALASFPQTPGMRLYVNPDTLEYRVEDPLYENTSMLGRIQQWLREKRLINSASPPIQGVPPQTGKLDKHRMKTLVRECIWLIDAKEAKRIEGPQPTHENAELLDGNYLLNPGSRVTNTQPMFEKDYDNWLQRLQSIED